MYDVEAVESMELEPLLLIVLSCKMHEESKLSILLHHQVVEGGLLKEQGLQNRPVWNHVRQLDQGC